MKYLFRLIALPFFIAFVLISLFRDTLILAFGFMRYGGELVTFKKNSKETIRELFNLIESKNR